MKKKKHKSHSQDLQHWSGSQIDQITYIILNGCVMWKYISVHERLDAIELRQWEILS